MAMFCLHCIFFSKNILKAHKPSHSLFYLNHRIIINVKEKQQHHVNENESLFVRFIDSLNRLNVVSICTFQCFNNTHIDCIECIDFVYGY